MSTSATIAKEDFLCDICENLLYKPTVLTCGHVICGVGCLEKGKIPEEERKNNSGKILSDTTTSTVLRYECACGVCGQPLPHKPSPCRQLEDLIQSVFGEEYSARGATLEQQRLREESKRTAATEEDPPATSEAAAMRVVVSDSQTQASNESTVNLATEATTTTTEPSQSLLPVPFSSSSDQSGLTGPHAEIYKWLQGKDYTHFGIGCDCCGQFPITGRRYRCTACPETVGFDLCGDCYDRGVSSDPNSRAVLGRFNQRHTPEHKMELCRPRLTSLHMLRAANPELTFDQLMYLLQVSAEREEEEEEDNDDDQGDEGGERGGQAEGGENDRDGADGDAENNADDQQQHGEVETEERVEVENDIPMLHGRGPRPIQDPSAQWPSPSSFENNESHPQPPPPPPPRSAAEEE